ncbi:MAG: TonB-dependent receptor plug domain-containing protein [Pseudomonadota bacterium]
MKFRKVAACCAATSFLVCSAAVSAQDGVIRSFDRAFFDRFSPQSALEMINRVPGFSLEEADEDRGLSQGGTNVLINGRPITGKGDTATTQISQIAPDSVLRIEVIDSGTLDIPGFSGLVANIVTQKTSVSGSYLWEPEFKERQAPALANGNLNLSSSLSNVDLSFAADLTSIRVDFVGPETLTTADGELFETRDETFTIQGDEPSLSGSLRWDRSNGHILNAKTSFTWLDLARDQVSESMAVTARGLSGLNAGGFGQDQIDARFDTDYSFPFAQGTLKLISVAALEHSDAMTRIAIDDPSGLPLDRRGFDEESTSTEAIARFEQTWSGSEGRSWQLAGEGAFNQLELETNLLSFNTADPDIVTSSSRSETTIEERRGEATLAHSRGLSSKSDLQISLGTEYSTIEQGAVQRHFVRPKGFVSYTTRPRDNWTLSARAAREVGQINFRDFAASVSLFEEVTRENNPELVPEQSWVLTGRAERRFRDGHVASMEVEHELISDLVDRIPLGESGDAIGNIPEANQTTLDTALTLIGKPFGLDGAQLDLRGIWRWSSLTDPIEGFDREIGGIRTKDLSADFRHDIAGTSWSYGFTFQDLEVAPSYQSTLVQLRNVPAGGLTPGDNIAFVEHRDLFGFRARLTVSEFLGRVSRFERVIHEGRRDITPVDRIEDRRRTLGGPFWGLSVGRTF